MIFVRANFSIFKLYIKNRNLTYQWIQTQSSLNRIKNGKKNQRILAQNLPLLQFQNNTSANKFMFSHQLVNNISYSVTTQKPVQSQKPQANALTREQKLNFMKIQLQTNLKKYNLKSVLKLYNSLINFRTTFSEHFQQDIQAKIQSQISTLDQQGILLMLQLLHKQQKMYEKNNRTFRSLNILVVKGRKKVQTKNIFKILKLISLLKFPKSTIANFISALVLEQQLKQRNLHSMLPLQILKTAVIAIQMKEVSLQVKERILQSVTATKYSFIIDLVYLYHISQIMPKALSQTAKHQSIIKSVYDIAFNPYSNVENSQQTQQQKASKNSQSQTRQANRPSQGKSKKIQFNQQTLKEKQQQVNNILAQFYKNISSEDILKYINQKLSDIQSQEMIGLSMNKKKEIAFLLISNGVKSNNLKKLVQFILKVACDETGLNLDQFIGLVSQVDDGKEWLLKFKIKYYQFMSLKQKLTIKYYGRKWFNLEVQPSEIVKLVQDSSYSLDSAEFRCLLRVVQTFDKEDPQIKKTILKLLLDVQSKVDGQIQRLKRQKIKQEVKNQN